MRAYYAGMTTSNLDTIQQLRKELADAMRKEAAASSSLAQVTAENRSLHEPLAQVRQRNIVIQAYTVRFILHNSKVVPVVATHHRRSQDIRTCTGISWT